jgi:murein L,D-transpeptidase YcbB/YkuD
MKLKRRSKMNKVEWDFVVPVKMPISLKGVEAGKLPAHLLRDVEPCGKLHYLAADAWHAMRAAAAADGIELKPTSAGDTYRSYDNQKIAFLQRYVTTPIEGASTRTFEGKTWYLKKGMAKLATPGSSQHNWGLAIDIHTAAEKSRLRWLIDNVAKFGFSWEAVPEEPWHLRYTEGDNAPQAVKDWLRDNPKPAGAFGSVSEQRAAAENKETAASSAAASAQSAANKPEIKIRAKGKDVKIVQNLLNKKGYSCKADSDFGPKTEQLVKDFQKANNIPDTGVVNTQTWAALLA